MRFLQRFWRTFAGFFRKPPRLAPDEPIARFVTGRSHFSREWRAVKAAAFMPPGDRRLSVFRTRDLHEGEIWRLADQHITRTVRGRADLVMRVIAAVGLKCDPDDVPPRHASILGWPAEKAEQKLIALRLASHATLTLRPVGPNAGPP